MPKVYGGEDVDTNIITLCGDCHGRVHGSKIDSRHSALIKEARRRRSAQGIYNGGKRPYGWDIVEVPRCTVSLDLYGKSVEVGSFDSEEAARQAGEEASRIAGILDEAFFGDMTND